MSEALTLAKFYDQLANHDWRYEWSDDYRVWSKGRDEKERLRTTALAHGGEFQTLFIAYQESVFNDKPRPPRPAE